MQGKKEQFLNIQWELVECIKFQWKYTYSRIVKELELAYLICLFIPPQLKAHFEGGDAKRGCVGSRKPITGIYSGNVGWWGPMTQTFTNSLLTKGWNTYLTLIYLCSSPLIHSNEYIFDILPAKKKKKKKKALTKDIGCCLKHPQFMSR